MHTFDGSQSIEDRWSPILDAWLGESYRFRVATMAEQWRGIDRIALDDDGHEVGIDYKCDERAGETGNAFIETVSNNQSGRKGWALTSEAQWIFYFVAPSRVYALRTSQLRIALSMWRVRYRERAAKNAGYDTLGVCVPLGVVELTAEYVAHIQRGDGCVLQEREP